MNFSYFDSSSAQAHLYKDLSSSDQSHENRFVISITGLLDVDRLVNSLNALVVRHEALRTRFADDNGRILQGVCNDNVQLDIDIVDIDNEDFVFNYNPTDRISLDDFPLLKVTLYRLNSTEHFLAFRCHEILLDTISSTIILDELSAVYDGQALKPIDLQYVDYAIEQNEMLKSETGLFARDYWKTVLNGMTRSEFPFDGKLNGGPSNRESVSFVINKNEVDLMLYDSRAEYFHFFLAVYFIFIHKNSTDTDITVSLCSADRKTDAFANVVGNFDNIVPLRRQVQTGVVFEDFYNEIRIAARRATSDFSFPFSEIIKSVSDEDVANLTFGFQYVKQPNGISAHGAEFELKSSARVSKQDLVLKIEESGDSIEIQIDYNSQRCKPASAQRYIEHIQRILSAVKDTGIPIDDIDILTDEDRRKILTEFNDTDTPFALDQTFVDMFEDQVRKSPGAIAVVDDKTKLTYNELNARANQVAQLLVEKGVQQEELVPILGERSVEMLIGIIGVFKAGAAYVPVDLEFPSSRVISMLDDAKSRIMLTTSTSLRGRESFFAGICSETFVRDLVVVDTMEDIAVTRELFYESFLSKICKSDKTYESYNGSNSDTPVDLELDLEAKISSLVDYLVGRNIGKARVGVLLDNKLYSVAAALALRELDNEFITIDPGLSRKNKTELIRGNGISVVLTEARFLDEVDALLWEIDSLNTYILVDEPDADKTDKDSIVKDIFNFETERSIEEVNDYGWVSSYDAKPFSTGVMQQYIDNFCDKLSPFLSRKTKVLEIGCGHGLVLSNLAQKTGYYCATDLSDKVIDQHRKRFSEAGMEHVDFDVLSAKDISRIDKKGFFDVIVSSSVIHFFPNTIYLEDVIKSSIDLLADEGIIYIDQILDLSKKESMVRSNIDFNATHGVKTAKIHWDDDLFVDKRFFEDLQTKYPEIASVEFSEQNGSIANELKEFRYDLIIKVNKKIRARRSARAPFKNRLYDLRLDQATQQPQYKSPALKALMEVFGEIVDYSTIEEYPDENIATKPAPGNLSFVIYTSGSTGKPKGTMNEHIGMLNHCFIMIRHLLLDQYSAIAQTAPHCFDISVWQFLTALLVGGKTVVYKNEIVFNTASLLEKVAKDAVTTLQLVPSYLSLVIDIVKFDRKAYSLENVNNLVVCGEAVSPALVKEWLELFPNIPITNAYGPAEASDDISLHKMYRYEEMSTVPIGKPAENCRIYIVDNKMRLQPIGVKGEICVSGIGVGRGYVNNPGRTSLTFLDDPFRDEKSVRLYKTGDLGRYLPDGSLEFYGRKDYQVKIRGQRIELGEIEAILLTDTRVAQAVVVDLLDQQGNKYLCGYVAPKDFVTLDIDELKNSLRKVLPEYMVPSYLVSMKRLPLTSNGKINRKTLPPPDNQQNTESFIDPATEQEKKMLAIWKDVLGLERISTDSNFFEIGGHSLRAMKLVALVHQNFDCKITLKDVFLNPSIRNLASILSNKVPSFQEIPLAPAQEFYDVTPTQLDMWVLEHFKDGAGDPSNFYSYNGNLNVAVLERSYRAMIDRHEILRTVFVQVDGKVKQKVTDTFEWNKSFAYSDFRNVNDRMEAAENFVQSIGNSPFVLSEGPLVRLIVAQVNDNEFLISFNMHHIIKDGWSMEIFSEELMTLYNCFIQSKPSSLAPLRIQFKDYAHWYNQMLHSENFKESKEFWSSRFAGKIPRLNLSNNGHQKETDPTGRMHNFVIDESLTGNLRSISSKHSNSLFVTLLSSIYVLLYRFTGQRDLIVGTPVAGREHPDLANQIGLYLNVLPIRNTLRDDMNFSELLNIVKRSCLDAFAHQQYPVNYIIRDAGLKRSSPQNPLFDVGFVLQEQTHVHKQGDVDGDIATLNVVSKGTELNGMVNDLWFSITNNENRTLVVSMHYKPDRLDRDTIENLADGLIAVISAVGQSSKVLFGDIELAERTVGPLPEPVSIDLAF